MPVVNFYATYIDLEMPLDEVKNLRNSYDLFLNSIMALLVWSKIGAFVMTTKSFGVYIRMITHMAEEIVIFLIIWGAWVICTAEIFTLLFSHKSAYFSSIHVSLLTLFRASFNNFTLTMFDEKVQFIGSILFSGYVFVSSIFLMNMIIAVLSNVYADMVKKLDADYNASLVLTNYKMKWNSKYGLLIFASPPFNFVSFVLMFPLLAIDKLTNDKRTRQANKIFCKIVHAPYAFLLLIAFTICSFLLSPIAYLKGFILFPKTAKTRTMTFIFFTAWTFFGWVILIYYIIMDICRFIATVY